jgi:hypothetical protein
MAKRTSIDRRRFFRDRMLAMSRACAMRGCYLSPLLVAITVMSASAQNPLETLPKNYKLVMENEWARV